MVLDVRREQATMWVALAAAAACAGSLGSGFHFDDYGMLQDRAVVSGDGWLRCLGWLQTRPLTWLTFWVNHQLHGREALLWHAVNVALHVACAVMLYRILRRLMPDAALLGALLFAVHPVLGEAVDYVYARAIVLCALFSLLSFDAWIRRRLWVAVGWFTLALLSKEECVTLPLLLALYSWWRGDLRGRFGPLTAMLAVALLAGLRVIAAIQATGMKNIGANAGISPLEYLSAQGASILRYLGLLVVPWSFSIDPEIPVHAWMWLPLLALIAVCVIRFREVRAARWLLAGLILLIPSSSIFPAADLAADRRMYLPMIAFGPAIALLLPAMRRGWVIVTACMLLVLSIERTYVWASDERLWGEAVRLAPQKIRPRLQLSRALTGQRALEVLQEAERLAPQSPEVATELARVYLESGRPAEALGQAGRALAQQPGDPHALSNRGAVLLAMQQTAAARRDFIDALRKDACLQDARENLARSGGVPADVPACSHE